MATQNFKFGENAWNPDEWLIVRSPRWTDISHWEQNSDHIANYIPADLRPEDMQMGRDRTGETYISMLLKQPVTGNARMSTVCAFDGRMAPLIVLSRELSPVHHEHLEVVLYDRGLNLWHHFYEDGKPYWKLVAFLDLDLKAGEKYELTTEILFANKGKLKFYVTSWENEFEKNEIGEMVPATSTNDVECYAYKCFLDIYNSSNETKIMRDIQVVFSDGKNEWNSASAWVCE